MLNKPVEYALMAAAEKRHWWYVTLHNRVFSAIEKQFKGNKDIAILDAGCGTGGLWLKLQEAGYTNVAGADVSETAIAICEERNLHPVQTNIKNIDTAFVGNTFDAIICNDVLCYFTIEEIPAIIEGFKTLLKPGGLIIMNNPAFSSFSGTHDIAVGIVTRFSAAELKQTINYHLSVISCSCWPFLLSPAIYLTRKLQGKKSGAQAVSDIDMPPRWLNSLLYGICQLEMLLFKHAPWGSSVFIVARKEG